MNPETNQLEKILGDFEPWPEKTRSERDETLLAAFKAVHGTMKNLMDAVSGLNEICKHQQKQIDRMKEFLPSIE